jgi:hypothetical protein
MNTQFLTQQNNDKYHQGAQLCPQKSLKEEIVEDITEKFMKKLQDTVNEKVHDALKKYQDTTNKKLEKAQKQLNEHRTLMNSKVKQRRL